MEAPIGKPLNYGGAPLVERVLQRNQIPSPTGQAPETYNAPARISAAHLYAPLRAYTHYTHYAQGIRVLF